MRVHTGGDEKPSRNDDLIYTQRLGRAIFNFRLQHNSFKRRKINTTQEHLCSSGYLFFSLSYFLLLQPLLSCPRLLIVIFFSVSHRGFLFDLFFLRIYFFVLFEQHFVPALIPWYFSSGQKMILIYRKWIASVGFVKIFFFCSPTGDFPLFCRFPFSKLE